MTKRNIVSVLKTLPQFARKMIELTPLTGGMTNQNFKFATGGKSFVVRLAGANTAHLGIDRQSERDCCAAAHACAIAPAVVAYVPEHQLTVVEFVSGTPLVAEACRQPETMRRVAAALKVMHEQAKPSGQCFSAFDAIGRYYRLAQEHLVQLPSTMRESIALVKRIKREIGRTNGTTACLCHNDLLPANLIDDGTSVRLIDWEYAGRGDRFFDLANHAANAEFSATDERSLLRAYFGKVNKDDLKRLRLFRLISNMREAMWGFAQAAISTLDFDYLSYANRFLERFRNGCRSMGLTCS